jgi:trigger factor
MAFTYLGLEAQLTHHTVTEEEVNKQLHRLQQQNPRITAVKDRPTQNGDEVVLDYAGFCDGVQFPGGTAEMQTLVLGSGSFIPGFEEQLLDKMPGEQVTVHVTFPEQYHAADLAGKAAEFRCTLHEIRISAPYELDDVFAKEVGGCDTLDEMRQKMLESLQAYTDERGEMDLQDSLLRQAAETLEFTPDSAQLEAAVDEHMKAMEAQLARQGLTLDMYCAFTNTTAEDVRKDAYPTAEANLRNQAAVDKIVELEKLEATEAEIGEAVALVCRQNNITAEQLKPYYSPEFEAALIRSIMTSKVMQLIRDHANITHC